MKIFPFCFFCLIRSGLPVYLREVLYESYMDISPFNSLVQFLAIRPRYRVIIVYGDRSMYHVEVAVSYSFDSIFIVFFLGVTVTF